MVIKLLWHGLHMQKLLPHAPDVVFAAFRTALNDDIQPPKKAD